MSHEPEAPESEFVRKWKHDSNATILQAVQIIATLTAERDEAVCIALDNAAARDTLIEQRDALRTALEFYGNYESYRIPRHGMNKDGSLNMCEREKPCHQCGQFSVVLKDNGALAREALGGKSSIPDNPLNTLPKRDGYITSSWDGLTRPRWNERKEALGGKS